MCIANGVYAWMGNSVPTLDVSLKVPGHKDRSCNVGSPIGYQDIVFIHCTNT